MQKGDILSINTPKEIIAGFKKPLWAIKAGEMFRLMNEIKDDPAVESCFPFGQYHHVVFKTQENSKEKLEQIVQKGNHKDAEIKLIEPNIEDCFMALMKD